MPRRTRRAPWLQSTTVALSLVVGLAACRRAHSAGPTEPILSDAGAVDPAFRDGWAAVESARAEDPGGDGVDAAADALLAQDPPPELKRAAALAKVERRYLRGEDAAAITLADGALEADSGANDAVSDRIRVLRVRALARGGDADRALKALLEVEPMLEPGDVAGLRAIAADRLDDPTAALVAFAAWRARLPDFGADARYAEARIRALHDRADPAALRRIAREQTDAVAACLTAGADVRTRGVEGWVDDACRPSGRTVGVLLPTQGRFAALGDRYVAAVSATLRARSRAGLPPVDVRWIPADDAKGATAATRTLVESGVAALVGPPGGPSLDGVVQGADGTPVVVPGESRAGAQGVAPTLEARVALLVGQAGALGARELVVVAPDNAYGRRAARAASKELSKYGLKSPKPLMYSASQTSFSKVLAPAAGPLGRGAALLVADHIRRAELIVRQARRDQPDRVIPILSTGEGTSLRPRGARALEGVWVCPSAPIGTGTEDFVRTYTDLEGRAPDDQALLVWSALRRALGDVPARQPAPTLGRIEGGVLVARESQKG